LGVLTLGIVTGLAAEARLARPLGLVRAGGGLPAGAQAAAEWLVSQGVDGLLSFGLAGGLDPALRAGTIVLAAGVREDGRLTTTDPALSARFGQADGVLLAGSAVLAAACEKAALFAATGALAIDLESGAVARVAARHRLPCGRSATRRSAICRRWPWLPWTHAAASGRCGCWPRWCATPRNCRRSSPLPATPPPRARRCEGACGPADQSAASATCLPLGWSCASFAMVSST